MTNLTITRHAEIRMSQRGFRKTDLQILRAFGTHMGRNRIMLKKRDAVKIIQSLKIQIAQIERLKGTTIVVVDDHLITAYHQTKAIR